MLAFGIAALQSFGLLEPTFEFSWLPFFCGGESTLSVLDLVNGIFILTLPSMDELALGECRGISDPTAAEPAPIPASVTRQGGTGLLISSVFSAMSTIRLDLSSFALLGGAIGVGIGFGLQGCLQSGRRPRFLLLDRSIKPGDVIEIDNTSDWINSPRARYASIVPATARNTSSPTRT